MEDIRGKIVWITGASSGIGASLAYEAAKAGAKLILSARNEKNLEQVRLNCINPEWHKVVPLDLENYLELENKVISVLNDCGPVDILINNAGISQRYLASMGNIRLDQKLINTNLLGTIAITHPVLTHMLQRNSGQIAVVSSMLGLYGIQTRSAYSASKHGLKGYFESLRNELFQTNVHVTLIYPGYVHTPITEHALVADGSVYGKMDAEHEGAMSSEYCAQKILDAIIKKKPVAVISGLEERLGVLMARFFPAVFRYISPRFKV